MTAKLTHVIEFVANMDRAVRFYRDVIGFPLKFQSPEWSEFSTGETTVALHPASEKNPAGKVELGLSVPQILGFYKKCRGKACNSPWLRRIRTSVGCWHSLSILRGRTSASVASNPLLPVVAMATRWFYRRLEANSFVRLSEGA